MRTTYKILGHSIAGLVAIQAAAIALWVFGLLIWIDEGDGNTLTPQLSEDRLEGVTGAIGITIHSFGAMVVALLAIVLLIISFFAKIPGGVKWASFVFLAVLAPVGPCDRLVQHRRVGCGARSERDRDRVAGLARGQAGQRCEPGGAHAGGGCRAVTRARVRLIVGLALTLAIVGPLGWMWWDSRLPSTYSVMDMGELDYGGGPGASSSQHHGMENMSHGSAVSVADLGTTSNRPADVVVDLTARQGKVELASGETVEGFSLNGSSPGPLIEATVGQLVEVRLHNASVKDGVTLHWHGVDVPNAQDGVAGITQDAVEVGEDHTYRWVAPDAGTFWYHAHQQSHPQVSGGLFGGVLIHPADREPGVRDIVAMTHLYEAQSTRERPHFLPSRAGRARRAGAGPGGEHRQRSSERVDQYALRAACGRWVRRQQAHRGLRSVRWHPRRGTGRPGGAGAGRRVCRPGRHARRCRPHPRAHVQHAPRRSRSPPTPWTCSTYGSPEDVGFDKAQPDRKFEYSVGRRPGFLDGKPGLWWSVNGELYPDMPMFVVREGDVAQVRMSNNTGEVHPMHLHGHHAVVLSRNGKKATGSPWWFDSLDVQKGETFEVAFEADNPGIWMDHCHNLKHAREGMVTHLMYEGVTTPYKLGSDSGNTPE